MGPSLQELAARQLADYLARRPGGCFAAPDFALSLEAAYALQDAVAALRVAAGERIAGYKVGCTGPGTVAQFGMQGPIRGCLFAAEIRHDGALLDPGSFANLAIEGEMALEIGADGGIAAAFPIVELHHFVFRAPRKTLPELVANNGLQGGIVLPDTHWRRTRAELETLRTLAVRINGTLVESGALWPLPGGPEASLAWLTAQLAESGRTPEPGQIVLAGTPLGLYPVRPGNRIEVLLDGKVAVTCRVAASGR
jgi:2-keto-4-pentenoate hydratase